MKVYTCTSETSTRTSTRESAINGLSRPSTCKTRQNARDHSVSISLFGVSRRSWYCLYDYRQLPASPGNVPCVSPDECRPSLPGISLVFLLVDLLCANQAL